MPDQPMPQRSGRTAEDIFVEYRNYVLEKCNDCLDPTCPALNREKTAETQRQLFNALLEIVKQVDADNDSNGRYNACREIEAKMRVFFGQPGENRQLIKDRPIVRLFINSNSSIDDDAPGGTGLRMTNLSDQGYIIDVRAAAPPQPEESGK